MRAQTLPLLLTTLGILTLLSPPAWAGDVEVQLPAGDGFVVKDNTGAIERLRIDEATGNVSRNGALFVHTTGADNTFVGEGAGNTTTMYYYQGGNSAFGRNALTSLSLGDYNSAFGKDALRSNDTGRLNSAFGALSLRSLTGGVRNSAFGATALYLNTTGSVNSAFGQSALTYNSTGSFNSAFGHAALYANGIGDSNSAFGQDSLRASTTGASNSAFGRYALLSNTTGNRNVAVGFRAGYNQVTGSENIYIANEGLAGESGQIKIGTDGTHTDTFLVGDIWTTGSLLAPVTVTRTDLVLSAGAVANPSLVLEDTDALLGVYSNDAGTFGSSVVLAEATAGALVDAWALIRETTGGSGDSDLRLTFGTSPNPSGNTTQVTITEVGNMTIAGILVENSDARLKTDVRTLSDALDTVRALRPVRYRLRQPASPQDEQVGLIAQEVEAVMPELTGQGTDDNLGVSYGRLSAVLVAAIKEQQQTIEQLQARLRELERKANAETTAAGG